MSLPADEWEHLQDQVRKYHNKQVGKYFKNQSENDISTPKSSLRHACTIKDGDTDVMTLLRLWLFEVTVGHSRSLHPPVYGVPVVEYQRETKFNPQCKLYFLESYDQEVHGEQGFTQVSGQISFRIAGTTSQTFSRSQAEQLANRIYGEMTNPVFVWKKGWYKYTYLNLQDGLDLRLLVNNKSEGERVARAVLNCADLMFDKDKVQFIEHNRSYPAVPGTHRVYGKTVRKHRERPRVDVKFTHAQLFLHGQMNAINLVAHEFMKVSNVIKTFI